MPDDLLRELWMAREQGAPCVLATVVAVRGSAPRAAGAKAVIYADGHIVGTVGGGKFESLVMADAIAALATREPVLKIYPLHEQSPDSFGAICGGEVTVFIEPQLPRESMIVVGAGHCGQAICRLARECGFQVTLLDDRMDLWEKGAGLRGLTTPAPEFFAEHAWGPHEAVVIVSRNFEIDREALAAVLQKPGAAYVGMIGSRKKIARVFGDLQGRGFPAETLAQVHAPIGLDIGADTPMEIAVSVIAQVLQVLRKPRRPA